MVLQLMDHSEDAVETSINGNISSSDTTININDDSGWPTGGVNGPFVCTIDPDVSSEERILVASRTGLTLNGITRGWGTTASAHDNGDTIIHAWSAQEADDHNDHIYSARDDHDDASVGYMRNDGTRHDLPARHQVGTTLTSGVPATIVPASSAEGASGNVARDDHVHGIAVGLPEPVGTSLTEGVSTEFARRDHGHNVDDGTIDDIPLFAQAVTPPYTSEAAPTSPFNGQLWVVPSTRRIFIYNGTSWLLAGGRTPGAGISRFPATQTISGGAVQVMTFDAGDVLWDTDSMVSAGNNRIIFQQPGRYEVKVQINREGPTDSITFNTDLRLNGATQVGMSPFVTSTPLFGDNATATATVSVAAAEYVQVRCFNTDGSGRNYSLFRFTAEWQGPL